MLDLAADISASSTIYRFLSWKEGYCCYEIRTKIASCFGAEIEVVFRFEPEVVLGKECHEIQCEKEASAP